MKILLCSIRATDFADGLFDLIEHRAHIVFEARIGIAIQTTDTGPGIGQTCAAELFPNLVDGFARIEEVPEVGQRTKVNQVGTDTDQMVDDARQLAK